MRLAFALSALAYGCNDPHVLANGYPDGNSDGVSVDSSPSSADGSDATIPGVAMPRLIAPMSTSTVTLRQPTLRWVLGPGSGTPTVDLCADRACSQPLAINAPVLGDHVSARPSAPLPPGWVFWRVRVVDAAGTLTSATWQMWVGTRSASSGSGPADSSSGTIFDVNGDGYPDLLVGAGNGNAANVYVNNTVGSFDRIDLANPDAAAPGINCNAGGTCFGGSVANLGDINGDGYADFAVASWQINNGPGNLHIYFGGPAPSATTWNGAAPEQRLDLTGAFVSFGTVAAAGDVNGDGYADFLASPNPNGGPTSLLLGNATPSASDWTGANPTGRITLVTPDSAISDYIGFGPSASVGDVNGDGYGDFLIGASSWNSSVHFSFAHLYLGSANASAAIWNGPVPTNRIDLSTPDSEAAFGGGFGQTLAAVGDVDGDGYSDFVIGTAQTPSAHLYYGGPQRTATDWNGTGSNHRFDIVCPTGQFYLGWSVAGAGDVNGDGYADFLIGAEQSSAGLIYGAPHLYLGGNHDWWDWNDTAAPARFDLVMPDGATSWSGNALAGVGDVDHDGYADFLVGSREALNYNGVVHLNLGMAAPSASSWNGTTPPSRVDLSDPDGPSAGFGGSLQ
jgi:hypothetical protein